MKQAIVLSVAKHQEKGPSPTIPIHPPCRPSLSRQRSSKDPTQLRYRSIQRQRCRSTSFTTAVKAVAFGPVFFASFVRRPARRDSHQFATVQSHHPPVNRIKVARTRTLSKTQHLPQTAEQRAIHSTREEIPQAPRYDYLPVLQLEPRQLLVLLVLLVSQRIPVLSLIS